MIADRHRHQKISYRPGGFERRALARLAKLLGLKKTEILRRALMGYDAWVRNDLAEKARDGRD